MMTYQSALDYTKQADTEDYKKQVLGIVERFFRMQLLSPQEKREMNTWETKFVNSRKMYGAPFSHEEFLMFLRKVRNGDHDALSVILKQPSRRNPYERTIEKLGRLVGLYKCKPNTIVIEDGDIRTTTKGRLKKGVEGVDVDFHAANTNPCVFGNVTQLYVSAKHTETGSNQIYEHGGSSQNHNIEDLYKYIRAAVLARKNPENNDVGFVVVCEGRYGLQKLQNLRDYITSQNAGGIFAMSADELLDALQGNA